MLPIIPSRAGAECYAEKILPNYSPHMPNVQDSVEFHKN